MKDKSGKIVLAVVLVIVALLVLLPTLLKFFMSSEEPKKSTVIGMPELSETYFVGFDYCSYDLFSMDPVIIGKVRYDKRIETTFTYTDENGEKTEEVKFFDLSEEQYQNIVNGINLSKLYRLDPKESDPAKVCDGGYTYLIMYGKDDSDIKLIGGFCPTAETYIEYRKVVFNNIPDEFKAAYYEYAESLRDLY